MTDPSKWRRVRRVAGSSVAMPITMAVPAMTLTCNRTVTISLGRNDYIWGPVKRQRLRTKSHTMLPWYWPPPLWPLVVRDEAFFYG